MPKISIVEQDLTTPGVVSESTDVVYIPGLVNLEQTDMLDKDGNWAGLGYRQPKLFTSVSEFVTMCGERPVRFNSNLTYEGLAFKTAAKPGNDKDMFLHEGDSDPSYVMAKELLSAGLCVLYERINADVCSYEKEEGLDSLPAAGDADDYFYKFQTGSSYEYRTYGAEAVADTVPPYASLGDLVEVTKVTSETAPEGFPSNHYRLVDGKYVLYAAEAYDKSNTYTIGAIVDKESLVNVWDNVYENYAIAVKGKGDVYTYTKVTLIKKPFDKNNCYLKVNGMSLKGIYTELEDVFSTGDDIVDGIIDKGNYSIKYLTSGGYPVYEYNNNSIVTKMLAFAEKRGDCVAFIDHTDNKDRILNPYKDGSLYKAVEADSNTTFKANGDFGTMFTPWATYNRTTSDGEEEDEEGAKVPYSHTSFRAPASFAYLTALADSIKTNANWLAIAGATRGGVVNLASGGMDTVISNGIADAMQPRDKIAINAITNIKPYGNTIWGNRTLKKNVDNLVATSFLNIRNLVSDVKKTCYRTARAMTFEQDTDILWINFKAEISKLLNRMVSGYGISGYKIVRDYSHPKAPEKATICAKVILYPTYAVEDFYITIVLKDDEVTVE